MAQKFKGNVQVDGDLKLTNVTPDSILLLDSNGDVAASTVSATELDYLSGVTSSIQDQLDDKASTDLSNLITTSINQDLLPSANNTRSLGSSTLNYLRNFSGQTVSDTHQELGTIAGDVTSGSDLVTNVTGDQTFFSFSSLVFGTGIPANTLAFRQSATTFRLVNFFGSPVNATATNAGVSITWASLPFGVAIQSLSKPTTGASGTIYINSGRTVNATSGAVAISTGSGQSNSGVASGSMSINTGASGDDTGNASTGAIQINSGRSYSSGTTGSVTVTSGLAIGSGATGNVTLGSNNANSGATGDTSLRTGENFGSANTGQISISTGASPSGTTGTITVATGISSSGGNTGNVSISTGSTSGVRGFVTVSGSSVSLTSDSGLITLNPATAIDVSSKQINSLASPTLGTDAANKDYVDTKQPLSAGDISESSFSGANDQSSAANVTGLSFNPAVVDSFKAMVSVNVNATTSLAESFELKGIQNPVGGWHFVVSSIGDVSSVVFTITSGGQVQYTSANYSGFVSLNIRFRAITTSI